MDWPALLETLKTRGWTQVLLAKRIGIAQSAVSALSRGETKDPAHSTGEALKALLESGERPVASTEHATSGG